MNKIQVNEKEWNTSDNHWKRARKLNIPQHDVYHHKSVQKEEGCPNHDTLKSRRYKENVANPTEEQSKDVKIVDAFDRLRIKGDQHRNYKRLDNVDKRWITKIFSNNLCNANNKKSNCQ
jgi:hypothetical protein